jgi:CubicO group peptidase (beta-lactamase class C family)
MSKLLRAQTAIAVGLLGIIAAPHASADDTQTVKFYADAFAQAALYEGKAVGVGVGVAYKNEVFYTAGFGRANGGFTLFTPNTLFEIASNTKVFTTNILGQEIYDGRLALGDQLSNFPKQLGKLPSLTGKVTLEELADFAGGFPLYAPLCDGHATPGCRPSVRPAISAYGGAQFLDFFQHATPQNFYTNPPTPVSSLPAPYNYSDFAIGLLGLLMPSGGVINDASLLGWFIQVSNQILTPLGMNSTYLQGSAPSGLTPAKGYSLALASAEVKNGQIGSIKVLNGGSGYSSSSPPAVTILGGSTRTASAFATVSGGAVTRINIPKGDGGSGYIAPPAISFSGGSPSKDATAVAIVGTGTLQGELIAIDVTSGGAGYQTAPNVVIYGGRVGGSNAIAAAHIANGHVVAVEVTYRGAGYAPPVSVTVAPGAAESNGVTIWAPAGGLLSTVNDLTRFAAAASGISPIQSRGVPAAMAVGFRTA